MPLIEQIVQIVVYKCIYMCVCIHIYVWMIRQWNLAVPWVELTDVFRELWNNTALETDLTSSALLLPSSSLGSLPACVQHSGCGCLQTWRGLFLRQRSTARRTLDTHTLKREEEEEEVEDDRDSAVLTQVILRCRQVRVGVLTQLRSAGGPPEHEGLCLIAAAWCPPIQNQLRQNTLINSTMSFFNLPPPPPPNGWQWCISGVLCNAGLFFWGGCRGGIVIL